MKRWIGLILSLAACSSHGSNGNHPPDGNGSAIIDAPVTKIDAPVSIDAPPDAPPSRFLCGQPAPMGSPTPTPPPLKMACPTLVSGENSFESGGMTRTFQ